MGETLPLSLRQPKIGTREIGVAAEEGFEPARQIILETAKYLGVAIGMMGQIIDPSVVLLGGAMTFGGNSRQIGGTFSLPSDNQSESQHSSRLVKTSLSNTHHLETQQESLVQRKPHNIKAVKYDHSKRTYPMSDFSRASEASIAAADEIEQLIRNCEKKAASVS